jgi:hypothetical protein
MIHKHRSVFKAYFAQFAGFHGEFAGPVGSMDWRYDGSELAAVDQQSRLVIVDPRKVSSAVRTETAFAANKEAHVVWLSEENGRNLLVTGFDKVPTLGCSPQQQMLSFSFHC